MKLPRMPALIVVAVLALAAPVASSPTERLPGQDALAKAVDADDFEAIKALGHGVMFRLARLYAEGDEERKARVANVFYRLGWRSEAAKDVLMRDVHTSNPTLRLGVQYALGRVSDDPAVVDVLLENMRNGESLLFRDKAACALAYDQVHLTEAQKVRLYEGLIRSLDDPKPDVRHIAALALKIHTGQDKGFQPLAPPDVRARAVEAWRRWLEEYKSEL